MATEYIVNHTDLTDVADAIRAKAELTEGLEFPGGFIEAVSAIGSKGFSVLVDDTFTLASAQTAAFTAYQSEKLANLTRYVLYVYLSSAATAMRTSTLIRASDVSETHVVATSSSGSTSYLRSQSSGSSISADGTVTLQPYSSSYSFRAGDYRLIVMGEVNE